MTAATWTRTDRRVQAKVEREEEDGRWCRTVTAELLPYGGWVLSAVDLSPGGGFVLVPAPRSIVEDKDLDAAIERVLA